MAKELILHEIILEELYVLKVATGIFLAIGKKDEFKNTSRIKNPQKMNMHLNSSKSLKLFYPKAENMEALKLDLNHYLNNE